MSTTTYGSPYEVRKSSVSAWLSSLIQVLLRNSTQDAHAAVLGPALALEDVGLVGPADREPLRELEEQRPELAGGGERQQRGQEAVPDVVDHRRLEVLEVDVGLGRLGPQLLVDGRHLGRVLGEQRERLDVEDEPRRRALRPTAASCARWAASSRSRRPRPAKTARRSSRAGRPASWRPRGTNPKRAVSCPSTTRCRPGSRPCADRTQRLGRYGERPRFDPLLKRRWEGL